MTGCSKRTMTIRYQNLPLPQNRHGKRPWWEGRSKTKAEEAANRRKAKYNTNFQEEFQMKNYPLIKMNKEGTLLRPQHSYYSDEYTESMCDLFLRDCLVKDEQGKQHQYYRLHARQAHNMEMAFAYDIHCPDCHSGMLKQISRPLNYNELGLYRCPVCDKK